MILATILTLVLQNRHTTISASTPVSANDASVAGTVANPLDQLSSADIAQTVAQMNSLPETTAITNQAQSQAADLAIASTSNNVIAKPQVVSKTLQSRADIKTYVTQSGDTVSSLAAKFGVTSDSIRWSNNLSADTLIPGVTLFIPPVNGIVYTVKPGDTAASLATQFGANADQITAYNDAEINGLVAGEQIVIPGATKNSSNATAASIAAAAGMGGGGGFLWGAGPIYGYNGYDYGYCTWYVATQATGASQLGQRQHLGLLRRPKRLARQYYANCRRYRPERRRRRPRGYRNRRKPRRQHPGPRHERHSRLGARRLWLKISFNFPTLHYQVNEFR